MNLLTDTCIAASQATISSVTIFSSTLTFLVILVEQNRATRKMFPNNLSLIFSSVGLGFNMTLTLSPMLDFRQITSFNTDPLFHNLCITQAFLWQFFAASSIFWYVAFTNIMYNIIVKNVRVADLHHRKNRAYFLGFFLPFLSAMIPLAADAYGPRYTLGDDNGLECWLNDPNWQFSTIVLWLMLSLVWGGNRGYWIVLTLKKTKYKTQRSRSTGAMQNKRGYKLVQTLKENYRRNLFLLVIYTVFTLIIFAYYIWTTILSSWDRDIDYQEDPCLASIMYALDVSLLGTTLFCLFGITYENIKGARGVWRSVRSEVNYVIHGTEKVEPTRVSSTRASLLEEGNPAAVAGPRAGLAMQIEKKGPATVTTHIGTKINAQLGIFKSPMMNAPSAFFPDAVSGTSMPPNHHPAAPRLQQQRDEFTRKMLVYVEGRCKQMPAVEQSVVESFFEEILSEWDGEGEDGESEDFCCEIYDSALTLDDLDARLKRAKERFEDACTKDKV